MKQIFQISRCLDVIPSDTVDIPDPTTNVYEGSFSGVPSTTINVPGAEFITKGVKNGSVLYSVDGGLATKVVRVNSEDEIEVESVVGASSGNTYTIYTDTTQGCKIYIGLTGSLNVKMSGGGNTLFPDTGEGWLPLIVKRVNITDTTANNIKAGF